MQYLPPTVCVQARTSTTGQTNSYPRPAQFNSFTDSVFRHPDSRHKTAGRIAYHARHVVSPSGQ